MKSSYPAGAAASIGDTPGFAGSVPNRPPADDITKWLAVTHPADHAVEIRAVGVMLPGTAEPKTIVKRFERGAFKRAAAEAHKLSGKATAVYTVMNGIDPALPTTGRLAGGASAKDIPRRFRLLIDCDPTREGTVSATDVEKALARATMEAIRNHLADLGWPEPVVADSGNGWHLVHAIDLPNDTESTDLVKAVLLALATRFDTEAVTVDTVVHDPPRLVKLYGTLAAKGENTEERPHRYARVVSAPGRLETVPADQLRELVAELTPAPEPEPEPAPEPPADDRIWGMTFGATNGRPDAETRAVAYLARCEPAISGQGGHDKAFKAACKVGPGFDLPAEVAFRLLWTHFNPRCDPPWSEKELRHKVEDSYKSPKNPPCGWLLNAERNGTHVGNRNGTAAGVNEPPPEDDDQVERLDVQDRWPKIDPVAFHGIAGEIVGLIDPHTEADRVATLVQFLVAFANLIGRSAHFSVGATRHYLSLFCVLVGATAAGRKGTSWDVAKWVLELCDRSWGDNRIQSGLVSGEGLIHHVRDRETELRELNGKKVEVEVDPGVPDKRLLIVETELSRALKAMNREGNTLSDVVRQAWDSGNLRTLGKHKSSKATGAHISIIGHSTPSDVSKHLSANDSANGFANRFLWAVVRRSKMLPSGGRFDSIDWAGVTRRMRETVEHARQVERMNRDPIAEELWCGLYPELSEGKPGLLGAVTSRAVPQVLRLACVYALLDGTCTVGDKHLEAAVALWEYCEASARLIFGESHGDPAADKLMAALRAAPEGLSRKQIFADVFQKNKKSGEIANLLTDLLTHGLIYCKHVKTGGRPAEVWFAGRGPVDA